MFQTYGYAQNQWYDEWLHLVTKLFTSGFCGAELQNGGRPKCLYAAQEEKLIERK